MPTRCPDPGPTSIKFFAATLVLCMSLCAAVTQALPDDRDKPMRITAEKAERDDANGITVYRGTVVFIQGTLELRADKLTIHHQVDEDPSEIIAEGNPAKWQQKPELDQAIVYANAKIITYYKSEDRVHLQTDGYVEQDGSVVNGDSIDYFIEKKLIKAKSDEKRKGDRVVVVIPPSAQKSKDDSGTTESK
jgi:lipopolysaccharide export system protein LptA